MKRKSILIITALVMLAGAWKFSLIPSRPVRAADIVVIRTKLETYIEEQGFTPEQVQDATPRQWYNHAIAAGFTPQQLRQFTGGKNVLRSLIIKRMKRAAVVAQATALFAHIRNAGPDVVTIPLLVEIYQNPEVYGVDPNAFN